MNGKKVFLLVLIFLAAYSSLQINAATALAQDPGELDTVPEFGSPLIAAAIVLSAPVYAFLLVKGRK